MKTRRIFSSLTVLGIALVPVAAVAQQLPVAAVPQQQTDPMLTAMQQEMERSRQKLVLPGMLRPYFMEYRLEDVTEYQADASFGALTNETENHQRFVRVQVRVGSYKSDNSSVRGEGTVQVAPMDQNPEALRYALWFATDEAYKAALNAYSRKQADLKRFETPPTADDFSPAKQVTKIDPLVKLDLDREDWKQRVIEASGLYATDAHVKGFAEQIQYSNSSFRGLAVNRYLVNTDGTAVRRGYTAYSAGISVGTQARDGTRLSRDNGPVATQAKDLESAAAFKQRVIDDLLSLRALQNAPIVMAEDYHGPVLFSGDASTDVLNRLFVPNIEADKPDTGTMARTQGAFSSSWKQRVLPDFLDVKDDPAMKAFHGKSLIGSYDIDDEGVPAQTVQVVSKGILQNYLIDREPVKDFPESNGHGRAALGRRAESHSGVMIFTPTKVTPAAEMEKKILAMAKEQNRPFVYIAETMGGELTPRLLYRVTPDGKRELVRGAVFDELDQRSLRSDIIAAGDDPYIQNSLAPLPQTTIAPSLLFGDIAVKRAQNEQQKLPYYAPPQ
ncbi:peptidase U62 [Terriglobus albidus]|uniref:Peptidase U62 n=1 Tax=Terriglobus albidus TaxID=1592106 RepID=A0A5B9E8I0_9BACT|nr:metallopeptidase TldD-related protein [Terriglobus albidus]QEE26890.1 peptidase U62 [Terriglobus albidus]